MIADFLLILNLLPVRIPANDGGVVCIIHSAFLSMSALAVMGVWSELVGDEHTTLGASGNER